MAKWYRRTYGRGRRRLVPVFRVSVPANYAAILVGLRHRIGLSQQQLAAKVGAATKAVVYQWESGKRKPSPVFWLRIERLQRSQRFGATRETTDENSRNLSSSGLSPAAFMLGRSLSALSRVVSSGLVVSLTGLC
jgi:ribosome-binding protein aMBF1 (putative translation factor)